MAKTTTTKKAAVKKPAAKKTAEKKPAVKKAPAKKAAVKKTPPETAERVDAGKKDAASVPATKRVALRIVRKSPVIVKSPVKECVQIDTAKAVAFAMSIAEEMKRSAAEADVAKERDEIRLTRRPTTRSQGSQTEKFPESDLKEFRKRLLAARQKALAGADQMRSTGFNESEDHEADGGDGTNQTLRLQALGQMGNINRTIQQIEEALHRIEDGTYGVCTVCGQLIRKPRLVNQPFVLTCMECQSEMERSHK